MKKRLLTAALLLVIPAVLWQMTRPRRLPSPVSPEGRPVDLTVEIQRLIVRKTGDHGQISLTARFQQNAPSPLLLVPPMVALRTASGETAPRFIGPLIPEPRLSDGNPATITLHYWLPENELSRPLTLEAGGNRYPLPAPEITGTQAR